MKVIRVLAIIVLVLSAASAAAESSLDTSFAYYGIENIGIYTEAYEDLRSDNFLSEILVMESNPMLRSPEFYRYEYCNFDRTTPPLTSPGYPLNGATAGVIDESLDTGLTGYLEGLGWETDVVDDFTGGNLSDMLSHADAKNMDAVLVARYTPIHYFVPVEHYNESLFGGSSSIMTDGLLFGIGYIPALELYDTKTGARLWYSAYHTGHQVISKKQDFITNVARAEEFFVRMNIEDDEIAAAWAAAELTGNMDSIFTFYEADEKAVETMIELTMKDVEQPFPKASESGTRNESKTGSGKLQHLFWTDLPSYSLHGTEWGIGYTFDYIGDYAIFYKDESEAYPGDTPTELIKTLSNLTMHRITLPIYSIAFGNLSIDPAFSYGYAFPIIYDVTYSDIKGDGMGSYYTTPTSETVTTKISSFSLKIALKYYLRFTDRFSLFIGGAGSISSWWENNDAEEAEPKEFAENYKALYYNYEADLLLNASITAGIRIDTKHPIELFAEVTPVGPNKKPTISAGIKWLPLTWGWVEPHQTYVAENLSIF